MHTIADTTEQLENPVAFVEDPIARTLSSAYIHWRYFRLLLLPWPLSCDYSYNCVPMIEHWTDVRVLAPAGMYAAGALAVLALALAVYQGHHQARGLLWAVAFAVCTFLPASNIFFWVGTLIGERLLYMPSAGFALAVGWAVGALPQLCRSTSTRRWVQAVLCIALVAVLSWGAARTWERNEHWRTEESVFMNALEVCNESAKVHEVRMHRTTCLQTAMRQQLTKVQNVGIVHRRYERWGEAIREFRLARQLWPDYCEVDYWEGLTLLQSGQREEGIDLLRKAVNCKYTTAKAMVVLKAVLPGSTDAQEHHLWGSVLASRKDALASDHLRRSAALHIAGASEATANGAGTSAPGTPTRRDLTVTGDEIVQEHYRLAMEALLEAEGLLEQVEVGWCEVKYLQGLCMRQLGQELECALSPSHTRARARLGTPTP